MKWFLVCYFLFAISFFSFFCSGFIDSQDGLQYLAIARRMYYDHTFEMPTASFDRDTNIHMSYTLGNNGKRFSSTGLGYSLAFLPAVMVEDLLYKAAGITPLAAFPLQNDWPVLLIGSMINAFWGALLVVVLYHYLRLLAVNHSQARWLSILLVVSSNLFVYTKHAFAQLMFTTALTLAFYGVKRFSLTLNRWWLVVAGAAYGVVIISYNPTYIFPLLPFGLYYLLVRPPRWSWQSVKQIGLDFISGVAGGMPLALLYMWFNRVRFGGADALGHGGAGLPAIPKPQAYVLFEGVWGLLFSPGKSIFLFSPLLLILVFFWFKLEKKIFPELIAFLSLTLIYLYFIGSLYGGPGFLIWHGESSWGPRYLLPILPLGLIVVAKVYQRLSRQQKWLIFYPLAAIGIMVQLVGVLLPYQIRFLGISHKAVINGEDTHITQFGNLIPRYSPVFNLSKVLVKRLRRLEVDVFKGPFKVRLFDGWERPFDLGYMVWREPLAESLIAFDSRPMPVHKVALQFKNHQIDPSSSQSAWLQVTINETQSLSQQMEIPLNQEKEITFTLDPAQLKPTHNVIRIAQTFDSTGSAYLKNRQVVFLQILRINDMTQPIHTFDYPYVSPISQALFGAKYQFFGHTETNPWTIWHMHSGVYENSFDLWWLRPQQYWDLPKDVFGALLILNLSVLATAGWYTWRIRL